MFDYNAMYDEELPFAETLSQWISQVQPKRVIDVGCGPGMYVRAILNKGISSVGYDISTELNHSPYVIVKDLFDIEETADLIICLEVAEHLEPMYSSYIVEKLISIVESGGSIIWSAAVPGQGGVGHINCRPKEFWHTKFMQHKEIYRNYLAENLLRNYILHKPYMGWFYNNFMIFSRQ